MTRFTPRSTPCEQPINRIYFAERSGYYIASFFRPEDYLAVDGMPHKRLYIDGNAGRIVSDRIPWEGSGASIFRQAQFPLHSGRILGLAGRILISFMGIVVAILSVTSVLIWWRKRSARRRRAFVQSHRETNAATKRSKLSRRDA